MTKIICDPGSTHGGEKGKAEELIIIAAEAGAHAVKFQLLTQEQLKSGNIELPYKWLPDLIELGKRYDIEVFASVFNMDGIKWLAKCGCDSIKFSYSQQHLAHTLSRLLEPQYQFKTVYLSRDVMIAPIPQYVNLYCIPLYPVPYVIDFENIFPQFDGFSSHTLGIRQDIKAIDMGAQVVEKHFQGNWVSDTPDGKFALRPEELRELCDYAND